MNHDRFGFPTPEMSGEFVVGSVSFDALISLALSLKERLLAEVGPGEPVCLAAEHKALVAAAVLSAAAGGPRLYVPHALSSSALEEVVHATGSRFAVTDRERKLPEGMRSFRVEAETALQRGRPAIEVALTDIPCLHLFTGGSTGHPKVWAKSAANLFGEALFLAGKYGIGPGDTVLATVPTHHIYGLLFSVLLPLVSGARVVNEVPYFPGDAAELADRFGCSILVSSPVHLNAMAATFPRKRRFRLAYSSGGFLDEAVAARFYEATDTGVVEVYGSTETGGVAVRCRADGDESWSPLDGVDWKIAGERLLVASPFLSPGLELTEEGYFVTGDRVENAETGRFHLLGRADGVVKVGGKRVVLGDVRDKIGRLPGVRDAFVFSVPSSKARENDVAAILEGDMDESSARAEMAAVLEPAALPRLVRVVDRIPFKKTGKYDRVAAGRLLGIELEE